MGQSKHSQYVDYVLLNSFSLLILRREFLPNLDQASISPSRGPTYDDAYLNELRASTRRAPPPAADGYDADLSMDVDLSVNLDESSMQILDMSEPSGALLEQSLIQYSPTSSGE